MSPSDCEEHGNQQALANPRQNGRRPSVPRNGDSTEQVLLKDSYVLQISRLNLSGLDLDTILVFDSLLCRKVNKKGYFHSFPCGLSNSSTKKVWGWEGGNRDP